MTENIESEGFDRARRGRLLVVSLLAVAVIAVVLFGVIRLNAATDDVPGGAPTSTAEPTTPESTTDAEDDDKLIRHPGDDTLKNLSGQELIDALGDDIDALAKVNGMTTDEFKELLLRDETVRVLSTGTIYNVDPPR